MEGTDNTELERISLSGSSKSGDSGNSSQVLNHELQGLNKDFAKRQRRGLLLENLNLIPIFTGQDPNLQFQDFTAKFNSFADFLEWPKEDRLFAIQQRLAGPALQTFLNFKEQINSIEDFFRILGENYVRETDPSAVLEDFWNYKQRGGIPVSQYLAIAKQKCKKAIKAHNLPEENRKNTEEQWLISMLKKNLEPQIRKGVIARNPENLAELEKIAALEEKAWLAVKNQPLTNFPENTGDIACAVDYRATARGESANNYAKEISDLKQQIAILSDQIQNLGKMRNRQNKSNIVCYACNRRGHYKSEFRSLSNANPANNRTNQAQNRAQKHTTYENSKRQSTDRQRYSETQPKSLQRGEERLRSGGDTETKIGAGGGSLHPEGKGTERNHLNEQ